MTLHGHFEGWLLTGAGLFYAETTGFSRASSQTFNQLTDIDRPDLASFTVQL